MSFINHLPKLSEETSVKLNRSDIKKSFREIAQILKNYQKTKMYQKPKPLYYKGFSI